MHVYFSGVGGVAIGPLARIAQQAGHTVTGSNDVRQRYAESLEAEGINVVYGQTTEQIAQVHAETPIDWFVYTSALPEDHPEMRFCLDNAIQASKRDEFINYLLEDTGQRMIAVAGTHGKTNTTGMLIWICKQLNAPISYSVGTNISFGKNGAFDPSSKFFIYEADEFDRNFLHYHPVASVITSLDHDHIDTYPTLDDYRSAFQQFVDQSDLCVTWQSIADENTLSNIQTIDDDTNSRIDLVGAINRQNAELLLPICEQTLGLDRKDVLRTLSSYPGTERRFEKLAENIYTDYAHHPAEIRATLETATELSKPIVAVYQPHQNTRQQAIRNEYSGAFDKADRVFWLPTYLSRESSDNVMGPEQLSTYAEHASVTVAEMDQSLIDELHHLAETHTIILMGAGSIDDWARSHFLQNETDNTSS